MIQDLIKFLRQGTVTEIKNAVAHPTDIKITPTYHLSDTADIKAGTIFVESIDSLVDYTKRFHNSESAVFASGEINLITTILDWHPSDHSDYGSLARHKVILPLAFTDEWKAWARINGKAIGQKELGEFIEEYLHNVVAPDAAAVLETVLTLSGKKSVNYKNATRLANGDVSLVWEESTEAKAGQKGELKVPAELTLRIPVYAGCEKETTFDIRTMFRYNINDGHLTFQLKMLGVDKIHDLAFEAVYESLTDKLKAASIIAPLYRGAVTATPLDILSK